MTIHRRLRIRRDDLSGKASRRRWAHGRLHIVLDKNLSAAEARAEVRRIRHEEGVRSRVLGPAPVTTTIVAAAAAMAVTAATVVAFHSSVGTRSAPPPAAVMPHTPRRLPSQDTPTPPPSPPPPVPGQTSAAKLSPRTVGPSPATDAAVTVPPPTAAPTQVPATPPINAAPATPTPPVHAVGSPICVRIDLPPILRTKLCL